MHRGVLTVIAIFIFLPIMPVWAVAPAAPPTFTATTTNFASTTVPVVIPDEATVSDSIIVSGLDPYILDIDMRTFIQHEFSGDLEITLTSPAGTVVTITTDNGTINDDVFNGTLWDDSASLPVTDAIYANLVVQSQLVPEGAMAAFIGEDPNGVWTLELTDDDEVDEGSLDNWSLDITTLDAAPTETSSTISSTTVPVVIPDLVTVTDSITISGLDPYIFDINIRTFIQHTSSRELNITLTSPSGTVVTITTGNGRPFDNVFNGTLWDDSASLAVTDANYSNLVVQALLIPEGAMGAFIGENPNGVWTLSIRDDTAIEEGSLDDWSLDITTIPPPLPVYVSSPAIGAIPMNTTIGTATNQNITISETGDADLTISAINLAGDAEISLSTNPAPFTIVDGSGASQVVTVTCNSATGGTFSATLTVTNNSSTSPEIYNISCLVPSIAVSPTAAPSSSNAGQPQISVFDPAISKLGVLLPGATGLQGEKLEWVVTVSNVGNVAGNNVSITDTLNSSLRIDSVNAPSASVTISGQTVTVTYATLNVGQTVQFSIFTTSLDGRLVENTACVTASNQGAPECVSAIPVTQLPSTGETPLWRIWLLALLGLGLVGFVAVLSKIWLLRR